MPPKFRRMIPICNCSDLVQIVFFNTLQLDARNALYVLNKILLEQLLEEEISQSKVSHVGYIACPYFHNLLFMAGCFCKPINWIRLSNGYYTG